MVPQQSIIDVSVKWRDKKLLVKLNSEASLRELGVELQHVTGVRADTIKLIIPQPFTKSSKLFVPFSEEHSCLKLENVGIIEGKPLRMMGTLGNEVDQLHKDEKSNLTIAVFEDEENRIKQWLASRSQLSLRLPEGPYTFGDFRTLELPGIKVCEEPDPDDFEARDNATKFIVSDAFNDSRGDQSQLKKVHREPDPDGPQENRTGLAQSNPNDKSEHPPQILGDTTEEPDPDDNELKRNQDPAPSFCVRLTKAIEKLRTDLSFEEANIVLQTLFRMVRKIIESPKKVLFPMPTFFNHPRAFFTYKALIEVAYLIGFREDIFTDKTGKSKTFLVLKRDDPRLWLAYSIIESHLA